MERRAIERRTTEGVGKAKKTMMGYYRDVERAPGRVSLLTFH